MPRQDLSGSGSNTDATAGNGRAASLAGDRGSKGHATPKAVDGKNTPPVARVKMTESAIEGLLVRLKCIMSEPDLSEYDRRVILGVLRWGKTAGWFPTRKQRACLDRIFGQRGMAPIEPEEEVELVDHADERRPADDPGVEAIQRACELAVPVAPLREVKGRMAGAA